MSDIESERHEGSKPASTHRPPRGPISFLECLGIVVAALVAIAIVCSLIWGPRCRWEGERKNTVATQAIILSAINTYYTAKSLYPVGVGNGEPNLSTLGTELMAVPESAKVLSCLSKQAVASSGDSLLLLDGWGRPMGYSPTGGFGGRPVLISAGPNGRFGSAEDQTAGYDDVRSDK